MWDFGNLSTPTSWGQHDSKKMTQAHFGGPKKPPPTHEQ